MTDSITFTLPLEEDPATNELMATLPPEFLARTDWRAGDVIRFVHASEGAFELINVTKNERETAIEPKELPLFIVETVNSYRMRYAIRAKSAEHAMDTVTMQEAEEFEQVHLGEQIFSTQQVTNDQYMEQARATLSEDFAKNMIHAVDYNR